MFTKSGSVFPRLGLVESFVAGVSVLGPCPGLGTLATVQEEGGQVRVLETLSAEITLRRDITQDGAHTLLAARLLSVMDTLDNVPRVGIGV